MRVFSEMMGICGRERREKAETPTFGGFNTYERVDLGYRPQSFLRIWIGDNSSGTD